MTGLDIARSRQGSRAGVILLACGIGLVFSEAFVWAFAWWNGL